MISKGVIDNALKSCHFGLTQAMSYFYEIFIFRLLVSHSTGLWKVSLHASGSRPMIEEDGTEAYITVIVTCKM